jgi:molybdopterin/thiamine biosynthesis adenylyltransferase
MSIDWPFADEPVRETVSAEGFPPATHLAEPDLFCRQAAMPGHRQARLDAAHVAVIGCGGLGSWAAVALARMGVRRLTLIDPDRFDRSNVPRQLAFGTDVGQFKAVALARNVEPHMTNAGTITAINAAFSENLIASLGPLSALVVGVDNNASRLLASRVARDLRIRAVFCMLSRDGLRAQAFLQAPGGPCLSCVLPDLDQRSAAPCAAASIASCLLAVAHAVTMVAAALMTEGQPPIPQWRETSLDGSTERSGVPRRRLACRCDA